MEWRIFFPVTEDKESVDLFTLLGIKKVPSEERTDNYYQIKDVNFGFKLRNVGRYPLVELKIRNKAFAFREGDGSSNLRFIFQVLNTGAKS